MDNRAALINRLRSITALVLVALYIAGLIAMFMSQVQLGLILWVVSTLGGGGMLYWLHTQDKRREEAEKAQGDPEGGKDGQSPCA